MTTTVAGLCAASFSKSAGKMNTILLMQSGVCILLLKLMRFGMFIPVGLGYCCCSQSLHRIFRPQQLHGTVLPRQSSVDSGAISRGTHTTLRERDAKAAQRLHDARVSYNSRMKHWRSL